MHQKEDIVMKLKKITAVLLSAATLAAAPSLPILRESVQNTTVTAAAADIYYASFRQGNIDYKVFADSNGSKYAAIDGCASGLTGAAVPATVTYNGVTYPVKQVRGGAFSYSNIQGISFSSPEITISDYAFQNASKLSSVAVQSSVQKITIGQGAFRQSGIQTFNCYAKECTINSMAFEESGLRTILFGTQVQKIVLNKSALANTRKLTAVSFYNSGVTLTLGSNAFENSSVRDLSLPSSVTTIPAYCFEGCTNLVNLSLPSTLTTIKGFAFEKAVLPAAMSIPAKTTSINSTAFNHVKNVSAYYVSSANTQFKSVDGVMYTKDGSTLCAYPARKTLSSFRSNVTSIWYGAITNTQYLKTLNLPNFSLKRADYTDFSDNANLETVNISSTETRKDGKQLMGLYGSFFLRSKVKKFNDITLVHDAIGSQEPKFDEKFEEHILDKFEEYANRSFMTEYLDKMSTYVVNRYTNSSMSNLEKAVRLRQWVCERVIYDPNVIKYDRMKEAGQTPPSGLDTDKNHVAASIFLHKKSDGKYYTVCEGYARGYKVLMDKAGIPTDVVTGDNRTNSSLSGHAWNLVKLDGKWYHVDITWDDSDYDKSRDYADGIVPDSALYSYKNYANRYKNFLCSDYLFGRDGHDNFNWKSETHPELNRTNGAATDSTIAMRGDLNRDFSYNSTDLTRLQKYLLGQLQIGEDEWKRADVNMDGTVDTFDLIFYRQYLNQFDLWSVAGYRFSKMEY